MSVAFGLSPAEVERVADTSPDVLAAMRDEHARRWSTTDELLAGIYEVTHALYVATLAAGGVKQRDLPKPVRVPRPGEGAKKAKKIASSSELAQWIRGRRGGAG